MYKPKVNDYVKWTDGLGQVLEGWVYFVSPQYITVEIGVKCKDDENIQHCPIHEKTHCLVLCFPEQWNQLEYVKSRLSKHCDETYNDIPERY